MEQSLVLIKPDGVKRGVMGEIIARFEKVGLKIVAAKMVWVDEEFAHKHYGYNDEWFEKVGQRTRDFYMEQGYDKDEKVNKMSNRELGEMIQKWNIDFLTEGPVLAIVLEGPDVVTIVRKLVGATYPHAALPGTIRGDYGIESPSTADTGKRAIHNLVHASGSPDEAKLEIQLWFKESEIHDYKRIGE